MRKKLLYVPNIPSLTSPPNNPQEGDIYFDETIGRFRIYTGTRWANMAEEVEVELFSETSGGTVPSTGGKKRVYLSEKGWAYTSQVMAEDALRHFGLSSTLANGVIIPAYIYPSNPETNPEYSEIIRAAVESRRPIVAILNPNNGPGTSVDPNYSAIIKRLTSNGVTVGGYVYTQYGNRSISAVKSDIQTWNNLYPEVRAIFIDEFPSQYNQTLADYYSEICDFARSLGFWLVIANPGTTIDENWFSLPYGPDIFKIYEQPSYPSSQIKSQISSLLNSGTYVRSRIAALVYGVSWDWSEVSWLVDHFGWVFITNDTTPNPWDTAGYVVLSAQSFNYRSIPKFSGSVGGLVPDASSLNPSQVYYLDSRGQWSSPSGSQIPYIPKTHLPKLPRPGPLSGDNNRVIPHATASAALTTLASTANQVRIIPIEVVTTVVITLVSINISTASAGTASIGIYSSRQRYPFQPTNLLYQVTGLNTGATGTVSSTSLSWELTPGIYWLAIWTSSTPTLRVVPVGNLAPISTNIAGNNASVTSYAFSSTTGLPASAPSTFTPQNTAFPAIGILYTA